MTHRDPRIQEWEAGLPAPEELIPLTQALIPPDLALAFKIIIDPPSSASDIQNVSEHTLAAHCFFQANSPPSLNDISAHLPSSMHGNHTTTTSFPFVPDTNSLPPLSFLDYGLSSKALKLEARLWNPGADQQQKSVSVGYEDAYGAGLMGVDGKVENGINGSADSSEGGSSMKLRKRLDVDFEDVDSNVGLENSNEDSAARTLKRPRLVWTPPLHKRFVEAVSHLGIKNAVPKTIMQLMNVEGLTRENVASHLQKYRLYLKRMKGLSSEGSSMSDHLFASTPLPLPESAHFLSNHGADLMPFLMPVPMGSIGPAHMVGTLASPFSNVDFNLYNGFNRSVPSQRVPSGDGEYVIDSHTRPSSPQRQVLTLFPPNGT
eukprot:c5794_g1_i1 orf=499-1623(-)